ncbi:MAG: hypothetical protein IT159_15130 [Bryobacterales bacterium]|nr:hypothetical protein [Bryobacterales bacterium]
MSRAKEIWRAEGWSGLLQRLKKRSRRLFWRIDLVVMSTSSAPKPPQGKELEFKRLVETDQADIEALTAVCPWKIPKQVSLAALNDGWLCFVVKREGRIAAAAWSVVGSSFEDQFLGRRFNLGPAEAYHLRGFRVPECHDTDVFPRLFAHIITHLGETWKKTRHTLLVRNSNAARRVFRKLGWRPVGRVGVLQAFCLRFQYLWGREAFTETRRRSYFELTSPGKGPQWS